MKTTPAAAATALKPWGTAPAEAALGVPVVMEAWTEGTEAEEPLLGAGGCTTQKALGTRGSEEL